MMHIIPPYGSILPGFAGVARPYLRDKLFKASKTEGVLSSNTLSFAIHNLPLIWAAFLPI